jgi:hypothetical protein
MPEGTSVAVRNRFDGAWCSGFAIADIVEAPDGAGIVGYHVRRTTDHGSVLPSMVRLEDVIPVRVVVDAWSVRSVPRYP